ncbi:MAG: hypothetical protein AAFY56_15555, partial [Pseudomonadota bacterium]
MRFAARLKEGELAILPECKVLKASEVAALRDARKIVDDAVVQRDSIEAEARTAFAAEKTRGVDEGRAEGREQLTQELLELSARGTQLLGDLEQRIPEIVSSVVKRILGTFDDDEL